jgi:hypothetical protein
MTYFRMQLLSHGTGPLAPGHMAMPLPGVTSLSTTPARRRPADQVQPPRAYHRAARYLPQAGSRPREAPVDHLAGLEKAGPAGGQRRGSLLPGSEVQTGIAPGLSGSGTPAAMQITLFWRSVGGCGSEQVVAQNGSERGYQEPFALCGIHGYPARRAAVRPYIYESAHSRRPSSFACDEVRPRSSGICRW